MTGQTYSGGSFEAPYIGGIVVDPIACTYKWSDGTPFDYQNYYPPGPSCDGEGCLQLFADPRTNLINPPAVGYWNDIQCIVVQRAFICKKAAEMVTTI
uniref:C-type lectin domain-containing protein n=1 Tax=Acrobeloides nanus TaxID=290746 RepID=A0A914ELE7_9BILA